MHTMFICLGGTGTQIGTVIGNIYPLLMQAEIANASSTFEMFILDKDEGSAIFTSCKSACDRYDKYKPFLPSKINALPTYQLHPNAYQQLQRELQKESNLQTTENYSVMNLIGKDNQIMELASMCWRKEKLEEDFKDGNNRDPSRGSLDVQVCLKYFDKCSLFKRLQTVLAEKGQTTGDKAEVRVVILGGATGGMGSSLIVPLALKLKESFTNLRIDLVILGTYFSIPEQPEQTRDSFYRVADQIKELKEYLINDNPDSWWVYYAAMPNFDDICGSYRINRAGKRQYHILELAAALAAFKLESKKSGFYQTSLVFDNKDDSSFVDWSEIPFGTELRKPAIDFLRLFGIIICHVIPSFLKEDKEIKNDNYVKLYIKNPKENDNKDRIVVINQLLDNLKQYLIPYFDFWYDVQKGSKLGGGRATVKFFDYIEMEYLWNILYDNKNPLTNKIPYYKNTEITWMNFFDRIKPNKAAIETALAEKNMEALVRLMIDDIYNAILAREED